jgi:hypothetical protein
MAIAALLLAGASGAARADFGAGEIRARLVDDALELSGTLELALTPKVEEALGKGIALDFVIGVRLKRVRPWWWDERAGEWTLRRRIRFHALSGQYLVHNLDAGSETSESFTSLGEALRHLGTLAALRLPLAAPARAQEHYAVQLRVHLDLEALPTPLQPVAYTSLAWHLNSGWSTWEVAR